MAQASKDKDAEPELRPDGWARFEKAVDAAVKSGPKHKVAAAKALTPTRKPGAKPKGS